MDRISEILSRVKYDASASAVNERRYGESSAVKYRDVAELTNDELSAEYAKLYADAANIGRQLADDVDAALDRGEHWRHRAKKARRHILLRVDQLRVEATKRGLLTVIDPDAAVRVAEKEAEAKARVSAQAEQKRIREEEQAEQRRRREEEKNLRLAKSEQERAAHIESVARAKHDQKMARIQAADARNRTNDRLFIRAVKAIYGDEEFVRLWEETRRMFPDEYQD